MPQIRHLARFTTPVDLKANDTKDTPIKTSTATSRKTFNDEIELILTQSTQPLSITEIAELASRRLNKAYDETTIRFAINELVDENRITYRVETKQERAVRSDNPTLATRSVCAKLYWAPVQEVPARTVTEVVPGFRLFGENNQIHRKRYVGKRKLKRSLKEVELEDVSPAPSNSNAVVDYLIEKMVSERTAEIQAQLDAANAKLNKLQELFKSAL
jgi:hypothetical protein